MAGRTTPITATGCLLFDRRAATHGDGFDVIVTMAVAVGMMVFLI